MKLTTGQIFLAFPVLIELSKKDIDFLSSYKISILITKISSIYQATEESRNKLVLKYSSKKEGETTHQVLPENMENFIKDFDKILIQENEVEFEKISIDSQNEINKSISFPCEKLIKIHPFVEVK